MGAVSVIGKSLEHVSEFKCLGFVFDELGIDGGEFFRKVTSWRNVEGGLRSLGNAKS